MTNTGVDTITLFSNMGEDQSLWIFYLIHVIRWKLVYIIVE